MLHFRERFKVARLLLEMRHIPDDTSAGVGKLIQVGRSVVYIIPYVKHELIIGTASGWPYNIRNRNVIA